MNQELVNMRAAYEEFCEIQQIVRKELGEADDGEN
jgi:hypothetical protein